ncbi:actin-like ATPase involved in cell morphogenesis [Amycolatopsis lexingtonensis]|uniref:Actin-like ATPase involved in cell morphogenesis n=1 Tax=Amycolatopsis lexingtonensis TaxID=218822 RepID=A0ABR9HWB8_9PSEU|nr:Hsp70 family protein [Amycolatopsis lexingtonensis]MBE1495203.1 actin-like ATPase involved in cell morphogenesis [Amycolatopsis lexingtonensis]
MGYGLGIDLGTTFTAAAVDRAGHVEMVSLGDRTAAIPSVVLLRPDGSVLVGDAASRRAAVEPDRVTREFKRRLGDPTPVLLGGAPHSVASLMAHLLGYVVRTVAGQQGGRPDRITLTHPANWGPYKRELFEQVPKLTGIDRVGLITEPEAAAAHYAAQERLDEGAVVAVYDLGGGTFDATVLRKRNGGFEILGTPEGIEGLGGVDFDEAVFGHVDRALDGKLSQIDPDDPGAVAAVVRLRQECVLAKEALSADTEVAVPVLLPSVQTEVRLTRGEFEEMIRPSITATIGSLHRALRSANLRPADLGAVLLVGGSSRIPLVSQLVSAELGRPTAVDIHPKYGVALGAAALASGRSGLVQATEARPAFPPPVPRVPSPREETRVPPPREETRAMATPGFGAGAPPPSLGRQKSGSPARRASRRGVVVGLCAVAVVAIGGVAVAVSNSGGSPSGSTPPPATTSESETPALVTLPPPETPETTHATVAPPHTNAPVTTRRKVPPKTSPTKTTTPTTTTTTPTTTTPPTT